MTLYVQLPIRPSIKVRRVWPNSAALSQIFSRNRTVSTPAQQPLHYSRERSRPIGLTMPWSRMKRKATQMTRRVWWRQLYTWRTLMIRRTILHPNNRVGLMELWAKPLLWSPPLNTDFQAKNKTRKQPWKPSMMPRQSLFFPLGRIPWGTHPCEISWDTTKG